MVCKNILEELTQTLDEIRLDALFNDDLEIHNGKSSLLFLNALADIQKAINNLKLSILEL